MGQVQTANNNEHLSTLLERVNLIEHHYGVGAVPPSVQDELLTCTVTMLHDYFSPDQVVKALRERQIAEAWKAELAKVPVVVR